jgi:hypothetical protein
MKDEIAGTIYAKDYTDWMVKTGGFARDMTLRDYFAGLAMQGLTVHNIRESYAEMAEKSYTMADAMLKERAK